MARAADSDSEKDVESKKKSSKDSKEQATEDGNDASNAEGSEEEAEYEIESIIEAKRGIFGKGIMGYLVSWKGFGPEDNSWVREEDAGNAKDLIEEYWAKTRKAKKASETKPKAPRTSTARASSPVAESASTTKKRGRGRPSKTKRDSDEEEEDTSVRARKKSRQSNGGSRAAKADSPAPEESDAGDAIPKHVHPSEIKKYSDMTSWERLVEKVETVEKGENDSLIVYFKMRDLEPCVEPSSLCAKKFPQKLIQFYESSLRWKEAEAPEDEAGED
ncbi:hypothetical protein DENSPDRAFT_834397 [Dentipellis sp. KUC8613]|nr:hypothetical protein DENSPDRAFT_834397 [Dentipellis sp. KUC8613]